MTHSFDLADVTADLERLLMTATGRGLEALDEKYSTAQRTMPERKVSRDGLEMHLRGRSWGHNGPDVGFRLETDELCANGAFNRNWQVIDWWARDDDTDAEARALVADLVAELTTADYDALVVTACDQDGAEHLHRVLDTVRGLRLTLGMLHRSTLRAGLTHELDPTRRALAAELVRGDFTGTPDELSVVLDATEDGAAA